MALWKPKAQALKDFALSLSCQGKMTQNPSLYTKKSRPLRPRFVRCWWWWSEGLNIYRIQAPAYNSYRFHSFPLLPCLNWGDSSKACRSFHQRAFDSAARSFFGTLTFLVYDDEEVSKQCSPWKGLSNSVLSFAHGIASGDLDLPNATRHHESETEDVLQATHWMHSMTAHTQGILWKMIEPRSRGWLCRSLAWKPEIPYFFVIMAKSRKGQFFGVIDQKSPWRIEKMVKPNRLVPKQKA